MKLSLPNRKARGGFTLTEMLVVVAIIVILAAVAVPITLNVLAEQKMQLARASMKSNIVSAVKQFAIKNNYLPQSVEELLAPPNGLGSLTVDAVLDPWKNPYVIEYVNADNDNPIFTVTSYGPNPNDPSTFIVVNSQ